MEQRITSLLLPAPEAELEASCKELDSRVTWLLHNNRKMDNYLELETFSKDERPRQTKKYKFYFFDYLYYMGEVYHENKWGESSWRMSGFSVLIWYWGLILYPFLSIGLGYIENSDTELAIMCGWGMFPVFFCFFRYRKARKYALMNYYEGKKRIGIIKLLFTPLVLFILEQWLFEKLGLTGNL